MLTLSHFVASESVSPILNKVRANWQNEFQVWTCLLFAIESVHQLW